MQVPQHVAIIMDGNGRWAAQRHLPRVEGHRAGIDSVRDVVEASARAYLNAVNKLVRLRDRAPRERTVGP